MAADLRFCTWRFGRRNDPDLLSELAAATGSDVSRSVAVAARSGGGGRGGGGSGDGGDEDGAGGRGDDGGCSGDGGPAAPPSVSAAGDATRMTAAHVRALFVRPLCARAT
eukprot:2389043-Pleurochrysis_carterae.AAC.1